MNTTGPIPPSALYEQFWKCRDLEIEHYWHRMVFMTAFLLACFAGYGGLLVAFIDSEKCTMPFRMANGVLFSLSIVGIVVSCLWLMMSKGSKAWYEEYEHLIALFMKERHKCFQRKCRKYVTMNYRQIQSLEGADLNDFMWSTKAGRYSVSKVGIAVGHLTLCIWTVLAIGHCWIARVAFCWSEAYTMISNKFFAPPMMGGCAIMVLLAFWLYAKCSLVSGYFSQYEK